MQYNKVEISGVNTSKLSVLTESEKTELLKRTKSGDRAAREELIKGNLRLVLSVIQKFMSRGAPADDLFQVGVVGLIKAIDNFDVKLEVKFSTYAVPMISGELRRYLRDNNSIRVSRSTRDLAYKAMQARERLINKNNTEPTAKEISKEIGAKQSDVVLALESISEPVSIYEPVYSSSGDAVYVLDQLGDSSSDEGWIDELLLKEAIKTLSDREKNILYLRFYQGKTQVEVANEIGISQAQVSRLEKNALTRIKSSV
ncbi:MAG TPA: RNA polymerase sporulation sigma factor SigG [Candidatus Faeciplasma avium]|uniref:RNA polymerase sigma factor n=1 Tax=Candidatus Faeciplasma avium TaxID=2840798 RepID=A0A9D1NPQ0_9FIRM|nr:RNA polymerase sporulation sigma factor SigG [Candidatus Faeciplasma avium]